MVFFLYLLGSKGTQKTFFLKGLSNRTAFHQLHHSMPLYAFDSIPTDHRFSQNHKAAQALQVMQLHALSIKKNFIKRWLRFSKPPFDEMVRLASTNSVNRVFCGLSSVGLCDKQKNTVGIRGVFFWYFFSSLLIVFYWYR